MSELTPVFRQMQEEDLEYVQQIEQEVYSNPWPLVAFESCYAEDSYVLFLEGKVIGYVCLSVVLDECSIMNIAICHAQQGKGRGELLLRRVITLMQERSVRYIYLDVRVSNVPARSLYEKMGFRKIGLRKNYYNNPDEDAIVMALDCEDLKK
ncbi:MAG: ribosomal protein S18-alanine N-acetyltransferase [Candidatus Cloacimonetes bacterium]|nr:ribosomal protein S18-alanine N-acetyltransferase [Candidatus Cloacimonadota bacterium]